MKLESAIDGLKKEELQALLVYGKKRLEQLIADEQQRAREEVEALRVKTEEEVRAKLELAGLSYAPPKRRAKPKKVKITKRKPVAVEPPKIAA